jgi:hypothetical protein
MTHGVASYELGVMSYKLCLPVRSVCATAKALAHAVAQAGVKCGCGVCV